MQQHHRKLIWQQRSEARATGATISHPALCWRPLPPKVACAHPAHQVPRGPLARLGHQVRLDPSSGVTVRATGDGDRCGCSPGTQLRRLIQESHRLDTGCHPVAAATFLGLQKRARNTTSKQL